MSSFLEKLCDSPFCLVVVVVVVVVVLPYVHRNRRVIRDGSPGRRPRLSPSS